MVGEREMGLDGIKLGLGHGVVSALAKRLTPAKPVHAEVTAFDQAMAV
jgi:hypothetical protein